VKSVTIVKAFALGDIVMATPMLTALHTTFPGVAITWITGEAGAGLLHGNPLLADVVALNPGRWRRRFRELRWISWARQTRELRARICEHGAPDAVICCHPEHALWAALFCGAPRRVGLFPCSKPGWTRRLYTHVLARPDGAPLHQTLYYLQAAAALGCDTSDNTMLVPEAPTDRAFLAEFTARHGIDPSRPIVAVAPFTTWETKNWEPERWSELIAWLRAEFGAQVIITLGEKDGPIARRIADGAVAAPGPVVVCAEGTTVDQYAALLRHSDVVVCCDSSALHIAAAVDVPFVALFGPTDVREIVPLTYRAGTVLHHPLPCAPCGFPTCTRNPVERECMRLITVAEVQVEVRRLLESHAARSR
jgi:ADP-heptose:LPS heptosyltransferase